VSKACVLCIVPEAWRISLSALEWNYDTDTKENATIRYGTIEVENRLIIK
jgi:hypothetical protein